MKKTFVSLQSGMIMEDSSKKIFLKNYVRRMIFTIVFPLQEHHNKMELLKGKIDLFKK